MNQSEGQSEKGAITRTMQCTAHTEPSQLQAHVLQGLTKRGKNLLGGTRNKKVCEPKSKQKIWPVLTWELCVFIIIPMCSHIQYGHVNQSGHIKKKILTCRQVILFLDDINMPVPDSAGDQPGLELIRQLIEFQGIYDTKTFTWKVLQFLVYEAQVPFAQSN